MNNLSAEQIVMVKLILEAKLQQVRAQGMVAVANKIEHILVCLDKAQ